ncbi:hypothetical protein AVEN_195307-1 [Araneus ventricosus]|uniref:Uncharacterized protein n=1 Tax=Araneus ventricosus TaxID=182803 RepID=A0A4Y2IBT5_ARAVE|nr:hypothetical protein AVEN_195307-1 [Araneus ventricosus]
MTFTINIASPGEVRTCILSRAASYSHISGGPFRATTVKGINDSDSRCQVSLRQTSSTSPTHNHQKLKKRKPHLLSLDHSAKQIAVAIIVNTNLLTAWAFRWGAIAPHDEKPKIRTNTGSEQDNFTNPCPWLQTIPTRPDQVRVVQAT